MRRRANLTELHITSLFMLVILVLFGFIYKANIIKELTSNSQKLELLGEEVTKYPTVSLPCPLSYSAKQGQDLSYTYILAVTNLIHGCYEPASNLLETRSLESTHRHMLAWLLGYALLSANDREQAAESWRYLDEETRDIVGNDLTTDALRAESEGDFQVSERNRQVLTFIYTDDRARHEQLGDFYLRHGMKAEAVHAFRVGSAHVSESESQYLLGRAAEASSEVNDAIDYYSKAIELRSENPLAYYRLARLAFESEGRLSDDSVNLCLESIRIAPDAYPCYELLARNYRDNGRDELAEFWLQKGLKNVSRKSYLANFLRELGDLAYDRNALQDAEAYYAQSLEYKSDDSLTLYGMGKALFHKGEFQVAIHYYEQAITEEGNGASAPINWLLELAQIRVKLRLNEQALETYQEVLARDPDNQVAIQGLSLLNK